MKADSRLDEDEKGVVLTDTLGGVQSIRSEMIDGKPWFVAKDVCDALGLDNVSRAVARLDEDERADLTLNDGSQNRKMTIISESGLYSLILSGRKEAAKPFKKWVTSEVLPSIRKTGSYSIEEVTTLEIIEMARDSELRRLETQKKLEIQKVITMVIGTGEQSSEQYCITSLQISQQTGKRHGHVMDNIKEMLEGLELDEPKFRSIYLDSMNRTVQIWLVLCKLPKQGTTNAGTPRKRSDDLSEWVRCDFKSKDRRRVFE